MFNKNLTIAAIVVSITLCSAFISYAKEGQCTQLLTTVCNDCHNTDRICGSMKSPETKWKAILDWMISNGAELEKEQVSLLANCLTEPFAEAEEVCRK